MWLISIIPSLSFLFFIYPFLEKLNKKVQTQTTSFIYSNGSHLFVVAVQRLLLLVVTDEHLIRDSVLVVWM